MNCIRACRAGDGAREWRVPSYPQWIVALAPAGAWGARRLVSPRAR